MMRAGARDRGKADICQAQQLGMVRGLPPVCLVGEGGDKGSLG